MAKALAERTPDTRNRYVDFLRAVSITVVVLGHWLMAAPAMDRGELGDHVEILHQDGVWLELGPV